MAYELIYDEKAQRQIDKLDKTSRTLILKWMDKNVDGSEDPRAHGKSLKGNQSEYWRYRVGDYSVLCIIHEEELIVVAVEVGNRSSVYRES